MTFRDLGNNEIYIDRVHSETLYQTGRASFCIIENNGSKWVVRNSIIFAKYFVDAGYGPAVLFGRYFNQNHNTVIKVFNCHIYDFQITNFDATYTVASYIIKNSIIFYIIILNFI